MQFRTNPRNGQAVSTLAFGCMRLPKDEKEAAKLVEHAIANGVNYFDTAYIYPNNEVLLGRLLQNGLRQRVSIATKLPPYLVRKAEDFDKLFTTQLSRLQTDYIDYYLIHMLPGVAEWERLKGVGILGWIERQKRSGAIRNIGFSYHGGLEEFRPLIDVYDWDFCMLQYNYFDENNQAGRDGVRYAAAKGVPVMVMEPLRGGRLANLPEDAAAVWKKAEPARSPAEWGLRWVWNQPEVLCLLSGMNSMEMLDENIRVASEAQIGELSEEQEQLYSQARQVLTAQYKVPCTGCNYCMPCPQGVDIPLCFACYNDAGGMGKLRARFNYIFRANKHEASRCIQCGKCEKHCPQSISIRASLGEAAKALESFPYRPMRAVVKKAMKLP